VVVTTEQKLEAVEHALDGNAALIAKTRELAQNYALEQKAPCGSELGYLDHLADKLRTLAGVLGSDFVGRIVEQERKHVAALLRKRQKTSKDVRPCPRN
jgi:hypothetical protein